MKPQIRDTPYHLFSGNLQEVSIFTMYLSKLHLANRFRNCRAKTQTQKKKKDVTNVHEVRCPGIVSLETRLRTGKCCN